MRGKDFRCLGKRIRSRITPAYAGKSSKIFLHRRVQRDHPRVCGEKPVNKSSCSFRQGSPPRMRGKVRGALMALPSRGITPAHAGKRGSGSLPRSCRRDHPRVCGEKISQTRRNLPLGGSPPRVRGKACRCPPLDTNQRITPARAGKRWAKRPQSTSSRDHPRMCGEKLVEAGRISQEEGSPPRMRGKVPSSI